MKSLPISDTAAVAALQEKWPTLHDLDRARAVQAIHQVGTSLRALAKALGRSPSLLRRLNLAAQAPPDDQAMARKGEISMNELVRRTKSAEAGRAAKDSEALERKCTKAAQQGSKAVCEWLAAENIGAAAGESTRLR